MMFTRSRSRFSRPQRAHLVAVLACFLVFPLFTSGVALGQNGQQEQLQQYLERNEELLETAHDLVRETESVPARRVLTNALSLHRQSLELNEQGRPGQSFQMARRCREGLRQAVRLARDSMGLQERLQGLGERFREQHAHLTEMAHEAQHQRALDMLIRSDRMSQRAQDQYQQGDLQLALQLLDQAQDMMNRAARMLAGNNGDRLARRLEMATLAVDRARETLQGSTDPAARDLLKESELALDRALDFRDQGRPGRALQLANLAQRMALRALGQQDAGPNLDSIRRQIERWDERAALVADLLAGASNTPAEDLFRRSREHRDRASSGLNGGDSELALRQIRAAHDLLGQAEDRLR